MSPWPEKCGENVLLSESNSNLYYAKDMFLRRDTAIKVTSASQAAQLVTRLSIVRTALPLVSPGPQSTLDCLLTEYDQGTQDNVPDIMPARRRLGLSIMLISGLEPHPSATRPLRKCRFSTMSGQRGDQ